MAKVITGNGSSADTSSSSSGEAEESDQIKDMKMSLQNLEKKLSSLKEDHEGRNNQYLKLRPFKFLLLHQSTSVRQ